MAGVGRVGTALLAVAALLLVAGLVVVVTAPAQASFGWFAYAPLSDETFSSMVLWSRRQLLGAALVVLGLLTAAAVGGYAVGRRAAKA